MGPLLGAVDIAHVVPKPLELVRYDEKTGKFEVGDEAAAILASINTPIAVIAVCGRARQGKSYILNQMLQRLTEGSQGASGEGFKVDSTHRPCTKGLWMWSRPVPSRDRRGRPIHTLLLDTEGIDSWDQTGALRNFLRLREMERSSWRASAKPQWQCEMRRATKIHIRILVSYVPPLLSAGQYSTQIFSLAILLSSLFVYNQMGGIDEKALDGLSLVTEMTKHIKVKAQQHGGASERELGEFSPAFLWLLRDFYLNLSEGGREISPTEYLEEALRPLDQTGAAAEAKNKIRASIKAVFPDRQCHTLVRPVDDEAVIQQLDAVHPSKLRPKFNEGMKELLSTMMQRAAPKRVGDFELRGPMLARLARAYVAAINGGAVPVIHTAWQGVADATCREAADAAVDFYRTSFNAAVGADDAALDREHDRCRGAALALFRDRAVGDHEILAVHEAKLVQMIDSIFGQTKKMTQTEAENRCRQALMLANKELSEILKTRDMRAYEAAVTRIQAAYLAQHSGPKRDELMNEFMRDHVMRPLRELQEEDLRAKETEIQRVQSQAEGLRGKVTGLEADLHRAKQSEAKSTEELANLKREVSDLKGQVAAEQGKVGQERSAKEREVEALRRQLAETRTHVAGLETQTARLTEQVRAKDAAIQRVEADLVAKRRELDAAQREVEAMAAAARERDREVAHHKALHEQEAGERRKAEDRARRAEASVEGARAEGQRSAHDLTARVAQLERENKELVADVARVRAEKDTLVGDRRKLQEERDTLDRELRARIAALQAEADAARRECERLRQEAAAEKAANETTPGKRRRVGEENGTPGAGAGPGAEAQTPEVPKTIAKIREDLNAWGLDKTVNDGLAAKWKKAEWEEAWKQNFTQQFGHLGMD